MKTRSSSPPLHVHVDDSTPVHVHVRKCPKTSPSKAAQLKIQEAQTKKDAGNLRATARVKTRVPWIPPGKGSLRESAYKWEGAVRGPQRSSSRAARVSQGPTHRLEITPAAEPEPGQAALRLADLSTDEEEALHGRISQYERKIDSLMNEVGSLKSEVELRKKEQLLERRAEQLSASQKVIEEQEEELAEVTKELAVTERENSLLRHSIEKMKEETDYSSSDHLKGQDSNGLEKQHLLLEKDALLKKLVEAEMDGAAAAKQVSALRETIGRMRTEKRMSSSDASLLARQKELLMQKLETFESTNRTLRHLLREQHGRETDAIRLSEQKEVLLKKLADNEADNTRLLLKLQEKEKELDQLQTQLETEKENARTTGELSKALESTRAHLQGQLRSREAENNRLGVQIRTLERTLTQQQGEMEHLLEQLRELKQRADADKEALKRATRAQKQRAERSEDTAGQLSAQLMEKETQLADALSASESWRSRHAQAVKDKSQLEIEVTVLNNRVTDLMDQLHGAEDKSRAEREGLLDRLHRLTSESTAGRLESQRLKASLSAVEEKLTLAQSEVQQLKASVKQYESLVESYKTQVHKTRAEADEYCLRLQQAGQDGQAARAELGREVELVRGQLLGRLAELEPLPELLRRRELELQAAQAQAQACERRSAEQAAALAELRGKVEQQGGQMEGVRERNMALLEENKQLHLRVDSLERKLEEANAQNRDLVQVIAKREETIHNNQLRLEEKSRECSTLARQLEGALEDARRQVDQTRERAVSKERAAQGKVLDLETQLSRTKTELNQLRRTKEDADRRFQSRLQDMRDRLEQSDSTNRSLQNYVQFLKASYANVFGDPALTSSALRPPSPI
nr:PREDICTED: outer dense fiber protein 2 isoform X2 [Lepisosteus oculatus]XP_015222742.1 PREDICTED: outer dense fiber protein 2 isoform X2 [Lepisosteus oculatus]XP_015222743.1 PREDICTED: outer dense fiber protein 2 isoform X2 [Lepisosteus oculatus]